MLNAGYSPYAMRYQPLPYSSNGNFYLPTAGSPYLTNPIPTLPITPQPSIPKPTEGNNLSISTLAKPVSLWEGMKRLIGFSSENPAKQQKTNEELLSLTTTT